MLRIDFAAPTRTSVDQALLKLRAFAADLADRSDAHRRAKERMRGRWLANFTSAGGIYGAWPPLAERTVEDRGGDRPILVRAGRLQASFVAQNAAGVVSKDATTWVFRNDPGANAYPVAHHGGFPNPNPRGGAPIPPRKLWDLNADDEKAVAQMLEDHVRAKARAHGI